MWQSSQVLVSRMFHGCWYSMPSPWDTSHPCIPVGGFWSSTMIPPVQRSGKLSTALPSDSDVPALTTWWWANPGRRIPGSCRSHHHIPQSTLRIIKIYWINGWEKIDSQTNLPGHWLLASISSSSTVGSMPKVNSLSTVQRGSLSFATALGGFWGSTWFNQPPWKGDPHPTIELT